MPSLDDTPPPKLDVSVLQVHGHVAILRRMRDSIFLRYDGYPSGSQSRPSLSFPIRTMKTNMFRYSSRRMVRCVADPPEFSEFLAPCRFHPSRRLDFHPLMRRSPHSSLDLLRSFRCMQSPDKLPSTLLVAFSSLLGRISERVQALRNGR